MKKNVFFALLLAGCVCVLAQDITTKARALYDRGLEAVGRATTRKELKAAAALLEEAKTAAAQWAEIRFALGRVYQALDIYDRAAACYGDYLALSPDAPDREEARKHVRICRQAQEWLDEDKRLLASGTWAKVRHLPPVRFSEPQVASRFRVDSKGRFFAQNPCLETFDKNSNSWIKEKWLPVAFDGKFFAYQYTVYYKALNPARTEYMIETVRGEITHGVPLWVRQEAWHRGSPTTYPYRADLETLRGEVLHAVR